MQIVFAGAGHANLVALDLLTKRPFDGHLTLVSSGAHAYYSGMVPGSIEGVYQEGAGTIPLAAFCARRGIGFLDGKILGLNGNQLVTEKGDVPFDLLIINTGAVARALAVKGQEHVLAAKPVEALFSGLASRLSAPGYVIAGAGAAGLEVAFALRARSPSTPITVVERAKEILSAFPRSFRRRIAQRLSERGIALRSESALAEVSAHQAVLSDGTRIAGTTLAFTGAAPSPLLTHLGLALANDGFLAVDQRMVSHSRPDVMAVGDVATCEADPRPKAGVFAVRSGPPLAAAVRAIRDGRSPPPVRLQRRGLVLLATGGRSAVGVRNGIMLEGRYVWRLKDHLDRAFVARFQAESH